MKIGRHRLVVIPGAVPGPLWTRKRVIAAAFSAVALVSLGAVLGATFSPHSNHEQVTQREISAPQPALETFYVPSQHVNQATRTEEQPDAF